MKLRWKITMGVVALGAIAAFLSFWRGSSSEQKAVAEAKRLLRSQGFKTDLSEFNFFTTSEFRAREAALTNAVSFSVPRSQEEARRGSLCHQILPDLMRAVGANSAIPVWRQNRLVADANTAHNLQSAGLSRDDLWPALRESFNADRELLDAACAAALSGPIRFNLNASHGNGMLLPHLSAMKNLTQTLGGRTVLELHDGNKDAAWTNMLASTRLVTAWTPEPTEISQLVRFACAAIAFNSTWQFLQADGWSDERLTQLQQEWESVNFFKDLPETAAFARASAVATCQLDRQQPLSSAVTFKEVLRAPRNAWSMYMDYRRQLHYRRHGSFEDEQNLLLHYRDREIQLQRALQSQTWSEIQRLAGVTNLSLFQSKHPSSVRAMLNMRQMALSFQMYTSPGTGQSFLGRAADAETRRRLIVTAIALERFRGRQGSYPMTLQELAPELLENPPIDFMDGQPLHYRLANDGHFILYSVGSDCVDNGGELRRPALRRVHHEDAPEPGRPQRTDLVWPRPASAAEIESFHKEQLKTQQGLEDRNAELQAAAEWRRTAQRQSRVEKILAAKPEVRPVDPTYRGSSLSEMLRNETSTGTNQLTLDELLTLRQIVTGGEPETVTFEAPINYDVLTNIGEIHLLIDPLLDEDSDEGYAVAWLECRRAANTNCLLTWSTIYESPGKHALQMCLALNEPSRQDEAFFVGPFKPFFVSNLCQFSLSSAYFNPAFRATLHAKLPEANGTYTIKITSPAGDHLRTIEGSTTNAVIKVHWDLTDDHGNRCTNNSFGTTFHVLLPESGRSQTQKGP